MIDLAPEQLARVARLLGAQVPECEVRAFGSRVSGGAKPYSDLDLVLLGPARLPLDRLAALREAFAESELPIRVDLVDWHALSETFRDIIAANCEVIQRAALPEAGDAPQTAPRGDRRW
jgi:type I restriction enzyme S subunit